MSVKIIIIILSLLFFLPNILPCDAKFGTNLYAQLDFCEVVDPVPSKACLVREQVLVRQVWNQWTGYYCYNYTNEYRLNYIISPIGLATFCDNKYLKFPVSQGSDKKLFWFDYTNETNLEYIRPSFKNDNYFNLWKDCCFEALICCDLLMTNENIFPTDEYPCPVIWDAWTCFPHTKAGMIAKMPCSSQAYSTTGNVCELESEKECRSNGTWNQQTDYSVCALAPVLRLRHNYHIIFLSVAVVLAFPSLIIFFCYHRLRNITRICLHRNLVLAITIRNLLTIAVKKVIILDALESDSNLIMAENGVPCRVLAFFENCAKNGIYACMLVDAFYLHKLIVRSFANEPNIKYLYTTAAVLSFLPSLIWAIVRGSKNATDCWMIDTDNDQWIPDGFRFAILACNFILLIDIIRVMVSKLKRGTVTKQLRTTFKATLFLFPLFGIHIIITANRGIVADNTCFAETLYYYFTYGLEGCQGIFVAFVFCYLNAEVHGELLSTYRKVAQFFEERFGWKLPGRNRPMRRDTAATYIYNPN